MKLVENGPFGGGTPVSISGTIFLIIKLPKSNFARGAHALTTGICLNKANDEENGEDEVTV